MSQDICDCTFEELEERYKRTRAFHNQDRRYIKRLKAEKFALREKCRELEEENERLRKQLAGKEIEECSSEYTEKVLEMVSAKNGLV